MTEMALNVTSAPEIDGLISKVAANENIIKRKTGFLLGPICQNVVRTSQ